MGLGAIELVTWAALLGSAKSNYPVFDINAQMRNLLLPADARIGSVIYRLRATDSDRDYPLVFAATDYGSYVIRIENLPCNKNSSYCEANVFLERTLAPEQVFKFRMTVRDTQGDTTTVPVAIQVTDGVTDFNEVFPHVPGVVMIPEDTAVGTELEYVIVKKHPRAVRQAVLELWGSSEFKFEQTSKKGTTTGVITLAEPLDYEQKTMYRLSVYATGVWVDLATDSRNIAGFQLVVIVTDVQDTPPIFDPIEPITTINPNLTVGQTVLRVTARDGDKGSPRSIRYGLLAKGNPYTVFFMIDQDTGDIKLARPLSELAVISRSHQPILVTVVAEEVVTNGQKEDPELTTTTATVALLLGQIGNSPPYFESPNYVTHIAENSPQGTALVFGDPYITEVKDNDMGKRGVFSLVLLNNNGTFEITPTVGERQATFIVRVRDNSRLDFEVNKELRFKIMAKEVSPDQEPLSTIVDVIVYIQDVNDNPPVFIQSNYSAVIAENATAGTRLVKFECTDADTGDAGIVKFTAVLGPKNASLNLNWDSGLLTIATDNHGFDREESSSYRFFVEARDMKGSGNKAIVPFTLIVLDVNDNAPIFERNPIEFILGPDGTNFSQRAFIKATDADAEAPNNIVRYEIVSGNYGNRYILVGETGELLVNPRSRGGRQPKEAIDELSVRAYDLGVPTMFSTGTVRIFPAESGARLMTFVVPGNNLDTQTVHQLLTELTGARVVIHSVERYQGNPSPGFDPPGSPNDIDRYIITATILYTNKGAVVDLETLQKKLANRTYAYATNNQPNRGNGAANKPTKESVVVYRTESYTLFWLMFILILLIILAILTLLFCCFCEVCPCYGFFNRIIRRKSAVQALNTVNYMNNSIQRERENKSVQAEWLRSAHRDAWSAEQTRRQWYFNRRNSERRLLLLAERSQLPHGQPNVVYTREMIERRNHEPILRQNELIVEDVDGHEYRLLDPSRLSFRRSQADTTSLRRVPSRNSDVHQQQAQQPDLNASHPLPENQADGTMGRPPTRDEEFFRHGNAEVLRLVTRGKENNENGNEDEEPTINQPERPYTHEEGDGKGVIMKKFIEDSNVEANSNELVRASKQENDELLKRAMTMREKDLTTADINRLTTIQRDILLTRFLVEENRRTRNNSVGDETQSLPGVVTMATQTDSHAETQTDRTYFLKRRAKSDIEESLSDSEDNGKRRLKKSVRSRMRVEQAVEAFQARPKEIKTPIMEEPEFTEGAHFLKNGAAFIETKASLLRHAASRTRLSMDDPEEHQTHLELHNSRSMSDQDISSTAGIAGGGPGKRSNTEVPIRSLEATPVRRLNILNNVRTERVTHDELEQSRLPQPISASAPTKKPRVASVPSNKQSIPRPVPTKRLSSSEPIRSRQSSKESIGGQSGHSSLERTEPQSRYMEWYHNNNSRKTEAKTDKKEPAERVLPRRRPALRQSRPNQNRNPNTKAPQVVDVDEENIVPNIKETESRRLFIDIDNNDITSNNNNKPELDEDGVKANSRILEVDHDRAARNNSAKGDPSVIFQIVDGPTPGPLRHQKAMEKKSIFTIAYDDMETKKIRLDTASP
ncbi:Hypothetical protein NTJ_00475 [Nesidiocoris tenuis]|uniref:Cadherin domain-containing protein n=1 Tax=Nesidiocoris tenuis TaxID=355587 RepID=A0ABN7A618_9HEMI|nr:Hypothetical protein NTJ_00475 [Nesidiocoris tenuis]